MRTAALEQKIKEREADNKNLELIASCENSYMVSMQKSLNQSDTFLEQTRLKALHNNEKKKAKERVKTAKIMCFFLKIQFISFITV